MSRKANHLQEDIGNDPRRLGKVTASRAHDVMARIKTGYASGRHRLMKELVAQRLTGRAKVTAQSPAMKRGNDLEPLAKEAYEVKTGHFVTDPDFTEHAQINGFGASPDGIVETAEQILIEIKCMEDDAHMDFLLTERIPLRYQRQMMAQCACTGAKEVDFVAYHPDFPDGNRLMIKRFVPTEDQIQKLEQEVILFLEEAENMEINLRNRK
tara:strand:- start:123 stop:755 length:633 start_codon:yes stop_codon:yes gene_type:complete